MSEAGQEANLMSEFDETDIVNGGYQENKGNHWASHFRQEAGLEVQH